MRPVRVDDHSGGALNDRLDADGRDPLAVMAQDF